jgi:hypothetical protein
MVSPNPTDPTASAIAGGALLRAAALQIEILAQKPGVRDYFDRTIVRWASEIVERAYKFPHEARPLPLLPFSVRDYSECEKVVVVARFHDVQLIGEAKPLGPTDDISIDDGEWGIFWPYFKLVGQGDHDFTETRLPILKKFVTDVEKAVCREMNLPVTSILWDEVDGKILCALDSGRPLLQDEIAQATELSVRTIGPHLKQLRDAGLICRPSGTERKGDQITAAGRAALAANSTLSAH